MTVLHVNGDGPFTALDPGAEACVELLEMVLAEAKNGHIRSICIVACGPDSFGASMAGPDAPRLNLGLDVAKADILARVSAPQTSRKPTLITPRRR